MKNPTMKKSVRARGLPGYAKGGIVEAVQPAANPLDPATRVQATPAPVPAATPAVPAAAPAAVPTAAPATQPAGVMAAGAPPGSPMSVRREVARPVWDAQMNAQAAAGAAFDAANPMPVRGKPGFNDWRAAKAAALSAPPPPPPAPPPSTDPSAPPSIPGPVVNSIPALTAAQINALRPTEEWIGADGRTMGYADELARQAAEAYQGAFGREADQAAIDQMRTRAAQGQSYDDIINELRAVNGVYTGATPTLPQPDVMQFTLADGGRVRLNKGGRARCKGIKHMADGGRVTKRDRFIEEQVEGKEEDAREKKPEPAKEAKADLSGYDPEYLKKYGLNPDGTKAVQKGLVRRIFGLNSGGLVNHLAEGGRPFSVNDLYGLYRTANEQAGYGDESGGNFRPPIMSEADFNALSERERMDLAGQYTTGGTNVYRDNDGNLVGYGDPRYIEEGADRFTRDPSAITRTDDGRFVISADNVNEDALRGIQERTDRSGFFNGANAFQNIARGAGIVLGTGMLANAGMIPGVEGTTAAPPIDVPPPGEVPAPGGVAPPPGAESGFNVPGVPPPGGSVAVPPDAGSGVVDRVTQWVGRSPTGAVRAAMGLGTAISGARGGGSGQQAQRYTPGGQNRVPEHGYTPGAGGTTGYTIGAGGTMGSTPPGDKRGKRGSTGNRKGATIDNDTGKVLDEWWADGKPVGLADGGPAINVNDPINLMLQTGQGQLARYGKFEPLEGQVITEAQNAGSLAKQAEAASLAGEDVAGQYGRQRGIVSRTLARGGTNPYGARAAAVMAPMANEEAAAKAAAMNAARRDEEGRGFQMRMAALGLGDSALKTGLGAVSGGVSALLDQDRTQAGREASARSLAAANASANAAMRRAEMELEFRREQAREGSRQFDLNFAEDQRRNDRNYDRSVTVGDREFDRNVFTGDRNFDFDVWRANNGIDTQNYNRDRQTWQDVGSGIRTGLDIYDSIWGDGGYNAGGKVRQLGVKPFMHGGEVDGPGDGTVDTVPAVLADGEMVVNAEGTALLDRVAPGLLESVNKKGLAIRKMRNGGRAASMGLGRR